MFDFNPLFEFSRTHCIAICASLVPINLLATLQTIILTGLDRPSMQRWLAAAIASIPAILMILHVFSWFIVGVVMAPTYILLSLGILCLGINLWAIAYPSSLKRLLRSLWGILGQMLAKKLPVNIP